ncbi:MAG: hypothetical protein M1826_004443 [Phylliscum demangeonii]|nr:MAG: hypothetical protein M1826_004443 [Phylliscum demangeonii]
MPARSRRQPTVQPSRRLSRQSIRRPNNGSADVPPSRDPLRALHDAEVYLILAYLDPPDIVCAGAVCRQWKAYIDSYICTTAMRRSFPRVWDEHKHRLPLNRLELAREYRRQACGYHALRTGKATAGQRYSNVQLYDIREPYVAWSDGELRFDVENLFSAKAAWQGTNALYRCSTTTRLNPIVTPTVIEALYLAATLDLLFLRVAPQFPNEANEYKAVEVEAPFATQLSFVVEDLATGEEVWRRQWAHVYFDVHILKTQDVIVLYEDHRVLIVAGHTGDIIGVVNSLTPQASVIEGSNTLVFRFRSTQYHVQHHFYHLRRHPKGGTDESSEHHGSGGRYSIKGLPRMHICHPISYRPSCEVFQRNMRDRPSVASNESTDGLDKNGGSSAACACVQQAADSLDDEPLALVPLAPFKAATPARRKGLSHYRVEHSALITLPPQSSAGSQGRKKARKRAKAKAKAKANTNTNDGRHPRRPFPSEAEPLLALHCRFLDEHRMDFMSPSSDLYILSFRAQW